jgi:hypothetical protein
MNTVFSGRRDPYGEKVWPPDVDLTFTHHWDGDEQAEIRELMLTVLSYFPEFHGKEITVGRTYGTAKGIHPRNDEDPKTDRIYIRLRDDATKFTVAHELYHVLTREKAVDVFALSRSPFLIDDTPGYLDIPHGVKEHAHKHRELLHDVAQEAVNDHFGSSTEMVEWFEQEVKRRYDGEMVQNDD